MLLTTDNYIALLAIFSTPAWWLARKLYIQVRKKMHFSLSKNVPVEVDLNAVGLILKINGMMISPDHQCYLSDVTASLHCRANGKVMNFQWLGTGSSLMPNDISNFEPACVLRLAEGDPRRMKLVLQDLEYLKKLGPVIQQIRAMYEERVMLAMEPRLSEVHTNPRVYEEAMLATGKLIFEAMYGDPKFLMLYEQLDAIFPLSASLYDLQVKITTLDRASLEYKYEIQINSDQIEKMRTGNRFALIREACRQEIASNQFYSAHPVLRHLGNALSIKN